MALFRGLAIIVLVQGAFGDSSDEHSADFVSPDPCKLCDRPDVQGPHAGELYNGDFAGFCNTCKKAKDITKSAPDVLKKFNDPTHDADYKSPKPCDLCKRPDVVGPIAGGLYNEDFKHFCRSCPSEFDKGKLGVNVIEQESATQHVIEQGAKHMSTAMGVVFSAFVLGAAAQVYRGVYKSNYNRDATLISYNP